MNVRRNRIAAALIAASCLPLFAPAEAFGERTLPPIRPMRTTGLPADIAAILLSGQQGGDLPVAVLAAPMPTPEGGVTVPVSIEIDTGVLHDFEAGSPDPGSDDEGEALQPERLEIFAYALGEDGTSVQDSLLQAYDIDAHRLAPSRRGMRYVAQLKLPSPPGQVRVLARLQKREAMAVHTVDISAPEQGGARLTAPLIAGTGDWIRLPRILPTGQVPPTPEIFAGELPAARAVIVRGQPFTFHLLAEGLEAVGSQMTLELTAGDGRLSGQTGADVTSYGAPDAGGQRRLDAKADSTHLPLGAFDLTAVLPGDVAISSLPVPVLVVEAEQASAEPDAEVDAWPWLIARLTAPGAPQIVSSRPKSTDVDFSLMETGLVEVFDHLAAGEESLARRRHARLALDTADRTGSLGLKALGKAEFDRARSLAGLGRGGEDEQAGARDAKFPEAVLPLATLNFELYREARRLNRTLVSTHARFMTLRLMELYLRAAANSPQAQGTAATLLVSLGGELQLADMVYFSERMFRKALTLDAEQPAALLALGMNYQLIGDVLRARDAFDALLTQQPGHIEASLRLARLEMIEGRRRQARRLLETAATGEGPSWVRSVAHQELARLDIDQGEVEAARRRLEGAVEQFPEETRLRVLLAFANEASQRQEQAKGHLAHTAAGNWPKRPSARRRFGSWSRESFVRNDRLLQGHVAAAQTVFERRWQNTRRARIEPPREQGRSERRRGRGRGRLERGQRP